VIGDFNAVRHANERHGLDHARINRSEIEGFDNFIDNNQLLELPAVGRKFTWYMPRLDRALISDN